MEQIAERLAEAVTRELPKNRLGKLYTGTELLKMLGDTTATPSDVIAAVGTGTVIVRYRGGWTPGVQVALDKPNRTSTLHRVGPDHFSLDTEAAIQAGAQLWMNGQKWTALAEVPDQEEVWAALAESRDLSALAWDSRRAGNACRDIVGLHASDTTTRAEIWEAKGKTAVVSDFYDTFGQVFPIDDAAVTKGWTNNSVPKHGLALRWAELLEQRWAGHGANAGVAVGVLVPDMPPHGSNPERFYDGPSRYYPGFAEQFREFALSGHCEGEQAFPRLLRHLRDRYDLMSRMRGEAKVGFRLLGYQGIGFIRDFATGLPLGLEAGE